LTALVSTLTRRFRVRLSLRERIKVRVAGAKQGADLRIAGCHCESGDFAKHIRGRGGPAFATGYSESFREEAGSARAQPQVSAFSKTAPSTSLAPRRLLRLRPPDS